MALLTREQLLSQDNQFYRDNYQFFIMGLMGIFVLMLLVLGVIFFQILNRPLPDFTAVETNGQKMQLTPFEEPNLLSDTLLRWASKAASTAFTFNFQTYESDIAAARPYFTDAGWADFRGAIAPTISAIVKGKLFVSGVVSGAPVINRQGPLPGKDYVWQIQIPFLVTYQSANITTRDNYIVVLSVVKVPTTDNQQGIGIDQFVMVKPNAV